MNKFNTAFVLFFFTSAIIQAREPVDPKRYELLSGVRNSKDLKKTDSGRKSYWDQKYKNSTYVFGKSPAKFLAQNYHYIPSRSRVLDMGMGEGRNAVFLARKSYKVTGIDISSVAVKKSRKLAKEFGVRINTVVASMEKYKIPKGSYDAVICFYYVDRTLHEKMVSWLRPGGILIYESHTENQLKVRGSENYDRRYLLQKGELLTMFPSMQVLKYEEPLHFEEYTASIILRKK